jgi:hypothetical protein
VTAESLPPPVVEEIDGILVVRDDRVPGGTKRRVLAPLLHAGEEYVYASPAQGYAQVALAYAAQAAGARATIFVAKRATPHKRTAEAHALGAKVMQVPHGYMSVVRTRARGYCEATGADLLPFGLDTPAVSEALADIARGLNLSPREVWTVAGSGALSRALQRAWPEAVFHAVRIGAAPQAGRARLYQAPEAFEQDARQPPPFPSCSNYDAKAWRFIRTHAQPGALFWNVAA